MAYDYKEDLTALFDFVLGNETIFDAESLYCARRFRKIFMTSNLLLPKTQVLFQILQKVM